MPRQGGKGRRPTWLSLLCVLSIAGIGLCVAWLSSPSGAEFRRRFSGSSRVLPSNPRHRNTEAQVKYVGDSACARCHTEISEAYARHPMGKSLSPVASINDPRLNSAEPRSFLAQGLEYVIEQRDGRVFHREQKRATDGRMIAQNEAKVRYVLGSGEQALAFLLERGDGYLFESPITWYSGKQKWDLSPGYEHDNPHFERSVKPTCLFCHSNQFEHVEGTENRYQQPIFQGHSIGCERCHGPGELHVRKPETEVGQPSNIVNPARLDPDLRESVCQQCHLQGDIRIVHSGRELTDFRPGMPLSAVETVFVKASAAGKTRFFGQVEQMYASRCFQGSGGRMGCISCHDPHELPAPNERIRYYRDRCVACHAEQGCRLPRAERVARGGEDHCIDCHMPRSSNEQVPHTATTLHLISRFADRLDRTAEIPPPQAVSGMPFVPFAHGEPSAEDRKVVSRDLGVALISGGRAVPGLTPAAVSRLALPLLQAAITDNPSDSVAWEATGKALWQLGKREEALEAARTAVSVGPQREGILVSAGSRFAQARRTDEAIDFLGRAIAINPWRADYHHAYCLVQIQRKAWDPAIQSAKQAVGLDPLNPPHRQLLVEALLNSGRKLEASTEFQVLLNLDPPDRDRLLDQYLRRLQP